MKAIADHLDPAPRHSRRLTPWLLAAGVAATCAAAYVTAAPTALLSADTQAPTPQPATADPAMPTNSISRQAAEWGVGSCMGQITTVSDFLTANQTYTAVSSAKQGKADGGLFAATIAAKDNTGLASVSSLTAAPVGDGCNTTYQTFASFEANCEAVRAAYFPGFTQNLNVGDLAAAYAGENNSFLFLLPTPSKGCAAMKTQVLYQVGGAG